MAKKQDNWQESPADDSGAGTQEGPAATPLPDAAPSPQERVWQVVSMIPPGKVATYGQVAALAGLPAHARLVGAVLAQLPSGTRLPWHRVVNAGLRISLREGTSGHLLQRQRLQREGVEFIGARVARGCRWVP